MKRVIVILMSFILTVPNIYVIYAADYNLMEEQVIEIVEENYTMDNLSSYSPRAVYEAEDGTITIASQMLITYAYDIFLGGEIGYYNREGHVIWSEYDFSNSDDLSSFNSNESVLPYEDGFIVAGKGFGVSRYDHSGTEIFQKLFGKYETHIDVGSSYAGMATDIFLLPSGNIAVAGFIYDEAVIMEITASGQLVKQATLANGVTSIAYDYDAFSDTIYCSYVTASGDIQLYEVDSSLNKKGNVRSIAKTSITRVKDVQYGYDGYGRSLQGDTTHLYYSISDAAGSVEIFKIDRQDFSTEVLKLKNSKYYQTSNIAITKDLLIISQYKKEPWPITGSMPASMSKVSFIDKRTMSVRENRSFDDKTIEVFYTDQNNTICWAGAVPMNERSNFEGIRVADFAITVYRTNITADGSGNYVFSDINLESVVRKKANRVSGELTEEHLKGITDLSVVGKDINWLAGLEMCPELISLDISYNAIKDPKVLLSLPNLQKLTVNNSFLSDSDEVLETLEANGVQVIDVETVTQKKVKEEINDLLTQDNVDVRDLSRLIEGESVVTVEANNTVFTIDEALIMEAAREAVERRRQVLEELSSRDVIINRDIPTEVEIQVTETEDNTYDFVISKDLLENTEIESIALKTDNVRIGIDKTSLKDKSIGDTLMLKVNSQSKTVEEKIDVAPTETGIGIMKFVNDAKSIGRTAVLETVPDASLVLSELEKVEQTKEIDVINIDINDNGRLVDGKLTITFDTDTNPYNCVFKDDNGTKIPLGGHEREKGSLTIQTSESGDYYVVNNRKSFEDIADLNEAESRAIMVLASKDILSGSGNYFSPEEDVTRAEVALALVKMGDLMDMNARTTFTDVANGAWYYSAVSSSEKYGIISGYAGNLFKPEKGIIVDEMVKLDATFAAYYSGFLYPQDLNRYLGVYKNPEDIPEWVEKHLALTIKEGIYMSEESQIYDGTKQLSKLDAAVMLYRLYRKL